MKRYIYVLAMAASIMQASTPLLATYETEEEVSEKTTKSNSKLVYAIVGGVVLGIAAVGSHYLFGGSSEGKNEGGKDEETSSAASIEKYKKWVQENDQEKIFYISDQLTKAFSSLVDRKVRDKGYNKDNWRTWIDKKDEDVLADFSKFFEENQINITKNYKRTPVVAYLTVDLDWREGVFNRAFALNHLFYLLDKITSGEKKKVIGYDDNAIVRTVFGFHKANSKVFVDQKVKDDLDNDNENVNAMPIIQVLLSHGFDPEIKVPDSKKDYIAYAKSLGYTTSIGGFTLPIPSPLDIQKDKDGKWQVSFFEKSYKKRKDKNGFKTNEASKSIQTYKEWVEKNRTVQQPISQNFLGNLFNFFDAKIKEKRYDKDNWRAWIGNKEEDVMADFAQFFQQNKIDITGFEPDREIDFVHSLFFSVLEDYSTLEAAFVLKQLYNLLDEINQTRKSGSIESERYEIVKFILDSHRSNDEKSYKKRKDKNGFKTNEASKSIQTYKEWV
ncbi:MAG: hypothetical protein AAF335_04570, partial [Bacteroidota bacterium]